jgi:hypothetical protein
MKRALLAVAAALGGLLAQSGIKPPLAGFARDRAGALRPVYGVTGSLILGEPIAQGVVAAIFDGLAGLAKTRDGVYAFDTQGWLLGRMPADWEEPLLPIRHEGDELIFRQADGTELRAKIEGEVLAIEQMGEGWFCVHQADRRLAVRLFVDRLEISRLPEVAG